jgi:F-box protein 9
MNFRASKTDVFIGRHTLTDDEVWSSMRLQKFCLSYSFTVFSFSLISDFRYTICNAIPSHKEPGLLQVEAAFMYPGLRPTMWRACLRYWTF